MMNRLNLGFYSHINFDLTAITLVLTLINLFRCR